MSGESALSSTEAELYDRQIRLWGVEAQKRLRSAKVLVVGVSDVNLEVRGGGARRRRPG